VDGGSSLDNIVMGLLGFSVGFLVLLCMVILLVILVYCS
jgi:hypothetical protein